MSLTLDLAEALRFCQAFEPRRFILGGSESFDLKRDILWSECTERKMVSLSLNISFTTSCIRPLSSFILTSPPKTQTP